MSSKKKTDEVAETVTAEQQSAEPSPSLTHVSKTDLEISRLIKTQPESFPDVSGIQVDFGYSDPFKVPKWADTEKYEYGWASVHDQVQLDAAINEGHWRIVNRSNHYSAHAADFHHTHGAIERRGMILMYRPWAIANKMREIPVQLHRDRAEAMETGKQLSGADLTAGRFDGETGAHKTFTGQPTGKSDRPGSDPKAGDIFASETPGEEGIKFHDDLQL